MKFKVCSSQYSNFFGNNQIHFPYSIACLVSYCNQYKEISDNFSFEETFIFRSEIYNDIKKCKGVDILLCSCYSWNWKITNFLAKNVKISNPNCIVIFGGPEVPNVHKDFFINHSYVDILVNGEGEITTYEILKSYINKTYIENIPILGTETRIKKYPPREKIKDFSNFPSPYTTNWVYNLSKNDKKIKYIASWETNRGCPFSCTFCDWGSSTMSKLRSIPEDRINEEIEWFGENKINYIDCCDSNFGILQERDYGIAKHLSDVKLKTGFPEKIGLTWAKTSSEKIIPIAKTLNNEGLLRAVSLSVQSFNKKTLDAIKRKNIKFDNFESLIKKFDENGIQSYTEIIMGLPEETVESFKDNWEILASLDPQPSIMVWNCSVFVNAPMNDPEYIKKYDIKTFKSPQFIQHVERNNTDNIQEFENMVYSTNSLPPGDIEEIYIVNWVMMVFHVFGISEIISRYFNVSHRVSYKIFYEKLIEYLKVSSGIFNKEYSLAQSHCRGGYSGSGWDYYDINIGNISWPIEEASWLHLIKDKDNIKKELKRFINYLSVSTREKVSENIIDDLIKYQLFVLSFPDDRFSETVTEEFQFDWKYYLENRILIEEKNKFTKYTKINEKDLILWGYKTIWYGRRLKSYKTSAKEIIKSK